MTLTKSHKLLLLAIILLSTIFANANSKFVSTKGRDFIAPDGKPLRLKGIGLGNWLLPEGYMFDFKRAGSPIQIYAMTNQLIGEAESRKFWKAFRDNYITEKDIKFIKQAGFNSIRVAFNYRLFVSSDDPNKLEGVGYELIERVVKWCKKEGLYVILDMHAAPGGQTGDNIDDSYGYPFLFENAEDQELTAKIWGKLAKQYRNEPAILGYDLLNEPIAHYFDKEALNPKLEPLYKKITAEIRKYDKNHIIIIGGAQWNSNFTMFGEPFDKKIAYTFHIYGNRVEQKTVQPFVDFGNKYNVPMWLGESGENTDEWIKNFRELNEQNNLGWCFWTYKRLNSTRTIASIKKPKDWDDIVNFSAAPRYGFDEIRKAMLPKAKSEAILKEYLENIKFENCTVNAGYLKALGLK